MSPRTLVFDLDGTLTDNFAGIAASIRHALQQLGAQDQGDAALRGFVGPPLRDTFARLLGGDEPALIERAVGHYRARFAAVGWRENVAYEGVPAMLSRLGATAERIYVCTSKPQVYARRIVEHFGFAPHFRGVYGSELDGRRDDKVELLAHLVAREEVNAADCVMIGDREHDIRAARANGVRAIGVLWGYGSALELAGADATAPSPARLPSVLDAFP